MRLHSAILLIPFSLLFSASARSAEVDYLRDIKPVLKERCYACHGSLKQKSGLRVDTAERILAGSKDGAIVIVGDPAKSELIARVTHSDKDERMPPEGHALKAAEIASLRQWVADGAPIPKDEVGEDDPRSHWAFQRIEKPTLPLKPKTANPIDAFLEEKRADRGLIPQPEADRTILLRRLYLDLIGLPPNTEQLDDERPYAVIVDELLANPQHGERWARHWMDVWRYTDWYGLGAQLRNSQKHIWRWRDWIVESLNEDKGYDGMIQEMLAGDELDPGNPKVARATGFLARNYFLFNRTTWLDNTIEHTGKALLGLTLNCAKCHDHKYDPISAVDYYAFRAIFEPHQVRLDAVPGESDFEKDGLPRVFDAHPDAETFIHLRGDEKNPDKDTKVHPGVPAILASFAPSIEALQLPTAAYAPGTRDFVQQDRLRAAEEAVAVAARELAAAEKRLLETPETKAPPPTPPGDDDFLLSDEFDAANPDLWDLIGGGWEYRDGALHQTQATRDKVRLRSKRPLPRDFELTCKYTHTGGATYKSVTFRFDLPANDEDENYSNYVYTSAHEAGPKVQAAYIRKGKSAYPNEGRKARTIAVGTRYELRFAVRDQLVNVWLDDELVVAYRYPDRQPGGHLAMSAFDATVAFDSLSIRALPADLELTEASNPAATSPADAEAEVKLAGAKVTAARAELASTRATIEADRARYSDYDSSGKIAVVEQNAFRLQTEAQVAQAELDVLTHQDGDAKKLKAARTSLKQAKEQLAAVETGDDSYLPLRGSKKAFEGPTEKDADDPRVYPATSTGRRTALAKWMTDRDNPLTARVAVNHVWMRHFGEPLVATVFDFGRRAPRPEHAELLDFLAAEFIDSGWSFRHLHRLIVTSQAYRLSSSNAEADAATLTADPDNHYYWRMNPRRMEAQVVRDSLLQLAGELDLTLGGPSIDPGKTSSQRRSLYFKHSRDQQDKFLTMFDDADLLQCYRRSESIVPQQALALSNSKLSLDMADKIATRLFEDHPSADRYDFIDSAFQLVLARLPDASERAECATFWDELIALRRNQNSNDPLPHVRAQLVHALLNHNDFVTIR